MNDNIKKIYLQVQGNTHPDDIEDYLSKFAEEIVKECIQIADDADCNWSGVSAVLKEHFGIE